MWNVMLAAQTLENICTNESYERTKTHWKEAGMLNFSD